MGAIVGVVIGYALGTQAGPEGWAELKEAVKVIAASDEAKDLFATGLSMARQLFGRGSEAISGALGGGGAESRRAA